MVQGNNHLFTEVALQMQEWINKGAEVHQKFTCQWCGSRQTIEAPNLIYTTGQCEECGKITDIIKTGCNFLLITGKVPK